MSFSHWLINRGVWRNPFNNREMMIGIPNRPLYFYQKDIIVIWYIQSLHFHHPDYPQFYHDSAGWYNGMAWYGSPSLGCVKATLVVKSTVFVNPLFAFRLETCFFFLNKTGWWFQTWMDYFPSFIWDVILPIDGHSMIFQDGHSGYCTTNQWWFNPHGLTRFVGFWKMMLNDG